MSFLRILRFLFDSVALDPRSVAFFRILIAAQFLHELYSLNFVTYDIFLDPKGLCQSTNSPDRQSTRLHALNIWNADFVENVFHSFVPHTTNFTLDFERDSHHFNTPRVLGPFSAESETAEQLVSEPTKLPSTRKFSVITASRLPSCLAFLSAIALLLGFQTQIAAFLTWVASVHLQQVLDVCSATAAYDSTRKQFLFWAIFLPLGAAWSLDRRKRDKLLCDDSGDTRQRLPIKTTTHQHGLFTSIGSPPAVVPKEDSKDSKPYWGRKQPIPITFLTSDIDSVRPYEKYLLCTRSYLLVIQVSLLYYTTISQKIGPSWHKDFSAVSLSLHLPVTRKNAFTDALVHMPALCRALTKMWVGPGLAGSYLVLIPCSLPRCLVAVFFLAMHWGMNFVLDVGPFPLVMTAGLVALLPKKVLDIFEVRFMLLLGREENAPERAPQNMNINYLLVRQDELEIPTPTDEVARALSKASKDSANTQESLPEERSMTWQDNREGLFPTSPADSKISRFALITREAVARIWRSHLTTVACYFFLLGPALHYNCVEVVTSYRSSGQRIDGCGFSVFYFLQDLGQKMGLSNPFRDTAAEFGYFPAQSLSHGAKHELHDTAEALGLNNRFAMFSPDVSARNTWFTVKGYLAMPIDEEIAKPFFSNNVSATRTQNSRTIVLDSRPGNGGRWKFASKPASLDVSLLRIVARLFHEDGSSSVASRAFKVHAVTLIDSRSQNFRFPTFSPNFLQNESARSLVRKLEVAEFAIRNRFKYAESVLNVMYAVQDHRLVKFWEHFIHRKKTHRDFHLQQGLVKWLCSRFNTEQGLIQTRVRKAKHEAIACSTAGHSLRASSGGIGKEANGTKLQQRNDAIYEYDTPLLHSSRDMKYCGNGESASFLLGFDVLRSSKNNRVLDIDRIDVDLDSQNACYRDLMAR